MGGIIAAILAAIGYGTANFVGGAASRKQHALFTLLVSQVAALVMVTIAAPVSGGHVGSIVLGAMAGLFAFCGALLAYVCFSIGRPIGVAAALLGTASAAVPVLAGIIGGQKPHMLGMFGLIVGVLAILLIAWPSQDKTDLRVAVLATVSGGAFGAYHVVMSHSDHHTGLWPLVASQTVIALLASGCVLIGHVHPGSRHAIKLSIGDGVASTLATIAALLAVRGSVLPIAGTLIALSPVATLLLARIFLAEHLRRRHAAGFICAATAVIFLTLPH